MVDLFAGAGGFRHWIVCPIAVAGILAQEVRLNDLSTLPYVITPSTALTSITADGLSKMLAGYATSSKIDVTGFGPHALRATAATNALDHER